MELAILCTLVIVSIGIEAFFAGCEMAFLSVNRPRLLRLAKTNSTEAQLAKSLISRPELLLSTTVVGTTLAMNFSTTLAATYVIERFGPSAAWMVLAFLTPVLLTFGEFIPKMLGRTRADRYALTLAKPLTVASTVLSPATRLFMGYAQILKIIAGEHGGKSFFLSREEIQATLPASRGSDVTASERWLISRILEFGKSSAKEMLRPLIDVVAIEEKQTIADAVRLLSESGHSRLPVYRDRIDRIVGVINAFDCFRAKDLSRSVKKVMHAPFFIPDSKPLDELLLELRTKQLAVAVNEYGGAEGIVTMEDVMEEIVGEIEDEYDVPPKLYHQIDTNSYLVNARMEVDALREELKIPIPQDEDYHTLAGFLLKHLQKIPEKWDSAVVDGVEYIVQSATDRSIEEVYIIVHDRRL